MDIRWWSPLACSINIRGGARDAINTCYTPPRETLATTSSRPNSEALATHVVLAHPHVVFYPYTCGLHRIAATVAFALIGYNDVKVADEMTTRRRRSWSTTSSIPTCDYIGSLLQLFFCCSVRLVVMIHDLLLTSILGWHSRSSASIAYPYPNSGIRAVLRSSWSGSCAMVIYDGY
jgi:hypothetical protein